MEPTWKLIYPSIKAAVDNLETVESMLQQAVGVLATVYQAECLLFAGLESDNLSAVQAYTTSPAPAAMRLVNASSEGVQTQPAGLTPVTRFSPTHLPAWVIEQCQQPHLICPEPGQLIVPIISHHWPNDTDRENKAILQLVIQLCRFPKAGWSKEDLHSIEVVCSQLGIAYSALYWRERLEQSRQRAALVGRIARLLNSSLNPDEIVKRIVAELGQGLKCDRCILIDLRKSEVNILATWDHPARHLASLTQRQYDRTLWQDVVDLFIQGGASYLESECSTADSLLQPWLTEIDAESVLVIPLFTQAEFFGAVAILSYGTRRIYQIDELQTVRQVADQAAIALTNAQHYQSLWFRQEALRIQNNSLRQENVRDELTQLMNRRSLERELEQISANTVWTVQACFSIIICDIDYFKLVNDTYGHLVGDEVLQQLALRLQSQLRKETPVYRYGGEEFVVILPNTDKEKAMDVAERLRQAIQTSPIDTAVGTLSLTASFGVTQQDPSRDEQAWDVVHRADQALYEAKRQGRDCVRSL
jgi:diguanylate cyclase (GGDEF)-like protein